MYNCQKYCCPVFSKKNSIRPDHTFYEQTWSKESTISLFLALAKQIFSSYKNKLSDYFLFYNFKLITE